MLADSNESINQPINIYFITSKTTADTAANEAGEASGANGLS